MAARTPGQSTMTDGTGIYFGECHLPDGTTKQYVGSSLKVRARIESHIKALRKGKHRNAHMQDAYNKYGPESFDWNVLEWCDRSERFAREQWWIEFLGTADRLLGYNKAFPVRASEPHPEASAKMRKLWEDPDKRAVWVEGLIKGNAEIRRRLDEDPEFAAKISAIRQGMWNDENRRNLSEIATKRYADPDYRDRHLTSLAEGREKLAKLRENPEFVTNQVSGMLSQWEKPERRKAQAERMRNLWKDPAFRAKQTEISRQQIIKYNKSKQDSARDSLNNHEE